MQAQILAQSKPQSQASIRKTSKKAHWSKSTNMQTNGEEFKCECGKVTTTPFVLRPIDEKIELTCGHTFEMPEIAYCTKKCMKRNMYYSFYQDKNGLSIGVEDECNGCGQKVIFDIEVTRVDRTHT